MRSIRQIPDHLAAFIAANGALLGAVVLFAYSVSVTLISAIHPQANWDLLAYTASALSGHHADPNVLQHLAYEEVRQAVQPGEFAALTSGDAYRTYQFEHPEAFVSMLGMYKVKALFISMIKFVAPLVGGDVAAIRLITTVSTAITGTTMMLWLYRRQAYAFAPLVIGFMVISGYGDIARLGSPDAFFMALFTLGMFLFDRGKPWIGALALFLSTLVRSDTVVFLAAWSVLVLVFNLRLWPVLAAFGAALAAYPLVTATSGHPGFWPHFMFSTQEQVLSMEGYHPAFSISVYLKSIAIGIMRCLTETTWPAAIALLLPVWIWLKREGRFIGSHHDVLIMALVGGTIGRFILFPLPDTRIHGAYLIVLLMALIPAISLALASRSAKS